MLLITAVAIAITCQAPGKLPKTGANEKVEATSAMTLDDLEFTMAVEEWIMATGSKVPVAYADMIDRLGDDCFHCREIASKKLKSASASDQRWLFWGRRHKAPEVRLRSNAIIRRLNPCSSCEGSGESRHYAGYPCWDCHGFRTLWLWSMWD